MIRSQNVITSTTWANKPSSYITGQPVFISNAGTKGSHWFYDGTRWKPMNGSAVLATLDSASASIGSSATSVFQYLVPAGLLQTGDRLRLRAGLAKSGVTDSLNAQIRFGTAGTTGDTAIFGAGFLGAAARQGSFISDFRLETATSVQMVPATRSNAATSSMGYGVIGTSALDAAVTISSASANALYLTLFIQSSGATDTVQAIDAQLQLISKAN